MGLGFATPKMLDKVLILPKCWIRFCYSQREMLDYVFKCRNRFLDSQLLHRNVDLSNEFLAFYKIQCIISIYRFFHTFGFEPEILVRSFGTGIFEPDF